jgi:hydroxyacylglutathione hydrolase
MWRFSLSDSSGLQHFGPVTLIPGRNGGRYPHCHSLLIEGNCTAVVDPASDPDLLMQVKARRRVDVVLNTHYHEDHWAFLFSDAEFWVHAADAPAFEDLATLVGWYGVDDPQMAEWWLRDLSTRFRFEPPALARLLAGGDCLDFGGVTAEVVHTPGHTPGHVSLWFPGQELLFLADLDLTPFGPYYADRFSDLAALIASVERVRHIPARTLIVSHGEPVVRQDFARRYDAFLQVITDRDDRILDFLQRPHTLEEILGQWLIYERPHEPLEVYSVLERGMVLQHLRRLEWLGEVSHQGDRFQRR